MSAPPTSTSRCAGAALLLVLWIIVLLTGLIAVFALTARTEGLQGRYLGRSVVARGAAETGVDVAAMHLQGLDPAQRWIPDGRANQFDFEGHRLEVRVIDEGGKVDLNFAPPELLVGLLTAVGVEQDKARALSGAIQDWRDEDDLVNLEGGAEDSAYTAAKLPYGAKDRPFEAISELRLVLGMDAALYRKLRPYITLFSGQARPDPAYAAAAVLRAMGMTPEQVDAALDQRQSATLPGSPLAAGGSGTYSISSRATRPDGTRVQVQAAIRMGGGGGFGQLYLPLSWRVGESD